MRDQMVLKKFLITSLTLRIRECSFGEAVSNLIVLSIDVGEGQILEAGNEIFCLPTPMKELRWGERSLSQCPIDDYK